MRNSLIALLVSITPAVADNIPNWSTTGCGLWTATGNQGTFGPSNSINPSGNYNINLNTTNCAGQQGPVGPAGPTGATGAMGAMGAAGTSGTAGAAGAAGAAGTAGAPGTAGTTGATGPTGATGTQGPQGLQGPQGPPGDSLRLGEIVALNAALSQPAWLETYERFSLSGGVGLGDGAAAFGMTGIMRLRGGVSGFAGFAVGPNGTWGGKVGGRVGW